MSADPAGKGVLFAIEGIDGSGTTTQARLLVDWLHQRASPAHLTQEPSSGPVGQLLRRLLKGSENFPSGAMALLFAADRVDHLAREIEPRLARGVHVVTDRYVYSSLAYQGVTDDPAWVLDINGQAPDADLTIYLRVPAEIAQARRDARGGVPEIYEFIELQRAIAQRYDQLLGETSADGTWQLHPQDGWQRQGQPRSVSGRLAEVAIVDGQLPPDAVHAQLCALASAAISRTPSSTELPRDDSA